jgi:hypothetical protein
MNKRGISAIVAMVLIILITVALVALLWVAIIPLINTQLALAEQCRLARASLKIDSGCIMGNNITATVSRNSNEFNLVDIQFGVGDSSRDVFTIGIIAAGFFPPSDLPGPNEKHRFVATFNTTAPSLNFMRIAPVINVGRSVRICEDSSQIEAARCQS